MGVLLKLTLLINAKLGLFSRQFVHTHIILKDKGA
jgi:hypothetical protein